MSNFLKNFIEKSKFWKKPQKTTETGIFNLADFMPGLPLLESRYGTVSSLPLNPPTGHLWGIESGCGLYDRKNYRQLSFPYYILEKNKTKEMLPKCYDFIEFHECKNRLLSKYDSYDDYIKGYKNYIFYTMGFTSMASIVVIDEKESLEKLKEVQNSNNFMGWSDDKFVEQFVEQFKKKYENE